MWEYKQCKDIVYIDIEKKLTVKPQIFCSNVKSPFADGTFDTIFIDPPHFFGHHLSLFSIPDMATFRQVYPNETGIPRYYGADKYKTQMALLRYIYDLQKECLRILKDDGLLWLKWNETNLSINTILHLFEDWHVLLKLPLRLNNPNKTQKRTYWVCLCKSEKKGRQTSLTSCVSVASKPQVCPQYPLALSAPPQALVVVQESA
jgi:hypothetical protein